MVTLSIVRQQGGDKLEDIALGGFQKIINQLSPKPIVTLGDQQDFINALRNTGLVNDISELQNLSVSDFINLKKALALEMDDTPITINFDEFRGVSTEPKNKVVEISLEGDKNFKSLKQKSLVSSGQSKYDKEVELEPEVKELFQKYDDASQQEFLSYPKNVQKDLINNIENKGGTFDFTNDKHMAPLPDEMSENMLLAIDRGDIPMPERYPLSDKFQTEYASGVYRQIESIKDPYANLNPFDDRMAGYNYDELFPFNSDKIQYRLGAREIGARLEKSAFDLRNMKMKDEVQVAIEDYAHFLIRKQDFADRQINPDNSLFRKIFNDNGSVGNFRLFDQYLNKARTALDRGDIDPEYNPDNLSASYVKYPYADEINKVQNMIPPPQSIEEVVTKIKTPIKIPKYAKPTEYYEPKFADPEMEKLYYDFRGFFRDGYLQRGHALMQEERIKAYNLFGKDNRILMEVKYPQFYTTPPRNAAHKRLERSIFAYRNRYIELQNSKNRSIEAGAIQSINDEMKAISVVLKNINHDMKQLGLVSSILRADGKGYKDYGKGFKHPQELLDSINKKQKLKFLGGKDDIVVSGKPKNYLVVQENLKKEKGKLVSEFEVPEGYKDGGLVSVEEMLGSDNG